jgi:ribosomal protein S18 acetylase RimI-like enzyme
MDGLSIRRGTEADAQELGALGAMLMRVHYGFDPQRFMDPGGDPERGYAGFLSSQMQRPDVAVFVAVQDGKVAGYIYCGIEPESWKELRERAGFVHDLVVATASRRGGIARALMNAAVDWLAGRGMPRVLLWTATGNVEAQALFEGLGFRKTMMEMTKELDPISG